MDWDISDSAENISDSSESLPSVESMMPGFKIPLEINRRVQKLILDYTIGAGIVGLIPGAGVKKIGLLAFLALILINLKMVFDIWLRWGKPKENRIRMILVILLTFFGAFAGSIMVRLIFSFIGLVIPLIIVLNRAVGHGTFTWIFGRATNQFFLNTTQANSLTLKKLLKPCQIYNKQRNLRH